MLEVSQLSIHLKTSKGIITPVDNISFTIEPGEILGLIGESGSGKSLTAAAIMRLLPNNAFYAKHSKILLYQQNILDFSEKHMRKVRGANIGIIFQDPMTCLNPVLTIGTQLCEAIELHQNLRGRACYIEALRMLDAVRIPAAVHQYSSYPHELSGGMQQRVMIAMALAGKPQLLIADEPTTALDVTTQAQILLLLKEIQRQENMALLLISHDLAVAAQMADRIAVMHHGKLVETNSTEIFFKTPQQEYSQRLLQSIPSLFAIRADQANVSQEQLLDIKDLKVHFPIKKGFLRRTVAYVKAVDGIDFKLSAGETLAIVGESGCGKTTVGKAILSLIPATAGTVQFVDVDLTTLNVRQWRKYRGDLQIVFQDPFAALDPKKRITDSLEEGLLALDKGGDNASRLALLDQLLTNVGLTPEHKFRYPHEFSGGERQRLCIARAVAVGPKIIVCDEPTSALDVSVQAQVLKLLQNLQQQYGISYIFISHDLKVVSMLAHRVAIMYLGRIVETGTTIEVLQNPKHPYTQALLAAVPKIDHHELVATELLSGDVPSALNPPSGCHFHPRCKFAKPECKINYPEDIAISQSHSVKCILYKEIVN
jgi:oligopeptide/dipeptide ABC transporter ATP-binding protein